MIAIRVQPIAGSDVKAVTVDAVRVADILGVLVNFDFNGVDCYASRGDNPDEIAMLICIAMSKGYKHMGQARPDLAHAPKAS